MNEATTFHCPSCSAPLEAPAGLASLRCPYCGSTVIPPQATSGSAQPGTAVTSRVSIDFQEYRDLLAQGEKMEAIKRLRLATGLGLKQSKDIIDALERGEDMTAVGELLGELSGQAIGDVMGSIGIGQPEAQSRGGKQAAKAAGIAGISLTCGVIAFIVFVLMLTLIPVFFAMAAEGGPLAPLWNQINPRSAVSIELRFGEEGIGAGQLTDPRAIAADEGGNIYVADYSTGRLQSFDPDGSFRWLANLGEDSYVDALDVAGDGALLVVARGALRRFNLADGSELPPPTLPEEYYFEDVNVAPDGHIAAIVDSEDILVLDPAYQQVLYVPKAVSSASGDSELDADIEIDGLGNLYVLGSFNYSVFKYSPDGRFTNRILSRGEEKGQLTSPGDLAVDGQGRIYVSDMGGVQIYDPDGRYLNQFNLGGYVFGLNFDLQDNLYTVSNKPLVMRLRIKK
jgi:DNA-directed RNA polymerase subunit RPC12/RpoP